MCDLPNDKIRLYISIYGSFDFHRYDKTVDVVNRVFSKYDKDIIAVNNFIQEHKDKIIEDKRIADELESLVLADKSTRNDTLLDSYINDDNIIGIINDLLGDELLKCCNSCDRFVPNYKLLKNYDNNQVGCFCCEEATLYDDEYDTLLAYCHHCEVRSPRASFVTYNDPVTERNINRCESCCAEIYNYIVEIDQYVDKSLFIEGDGDLVFKLNRKYADRFYNDRFNNMNKKEIKKAILYYYGIKIKYFSKTKIAVLKEYLSNYFYNNRLDFLKNNCDMVNTLYTLTIPLE